MNKAELKNMSLEELKQVAIDLDIGHNDNANKKQMIDVIVSAFDTEKKEDIEAVSEHLNFTAEKIKRDKKLIADHLTPEVLKEAEKLVESYGLLEVDKEPDVEAELAKALAKIAKLEAPKAKPKVNIPTMEEIQEKMKPFIARGLQIVKMDREYWHFTVGTKEASGNMKIPMGQFVIQADLLLRATSLPTEGDDMEEILNAKVKLKRIGR